MMEADQFFEILVREHADMLMVYLRTIVRDPTLVDDLFQETMLTAWRTIDRFDRQRPFGPWLRGIANKLVLASRRQTADHPALCDEQTLEQIDYRMMQLQRLQGDTLDEKLDALRECMSNLPDLYREAIKLRYQEQLKPQSITTRLQLNAEAVKKRLQRARIMLLECLTGKLATIGASR